jgi:cytochrome c-type biogenesis protein CcmH/NrfG
MRDTVEILRAAIAHHQAANHAEAETLYRTVLIADPGHPRALYLCGLLLLDTGRPHDAASQCWNRLLRHVPVMPDR